MKILMIGLVIGLLAIGSLVLVNALQNDMVEVPSEGSVEVPSCGGGCSAGNTCGNSACGAKVGKTCGCQG